MRQQLVSFDALGTFLEAVVVLVFLRFAPNGLVDIAKTSFLNTTIRLRNQ
jgi:hypothetical protein